MEKRVSVRERASSTRHRVRLGLLAAGLAVGSGTGWAEGPGPDLPPPPAPVIVAPAKPPTAEPNPEPKPASQPTAQAIAPPAVQAPVPSAEPPNAPSDAPATAAPAPTPTLAPLPVPAAVTAPDAPLDDQIVPGAGPFATPLSREARINLWERIRSGLRIPNLDVEGVQRREEYYSTRPDYLVRMVERSSRYLHHIVEEVERRRLPTDLALLPFIESAFNPTALSSAKASGIWQFMPATGRHFELKQTLFKDDRRSVVASTSAALDYLERLYGMFGDWHLALAAYNWGEGNVQRAIERNRREGLPTDYLSLRMPRETRDYVPKLQAIENIISRPGDFGLALPEVANEAFFTKVPVDRDIDVDLAARLSGLTVDEFKALNPQMNKPVILAAATTHILLPHEAAARYIMGLPKHRGPLASWTAWRAPETMRPVEAANRVGMSEAELREVNRIPPGMLVRAGSTLLVTRAAHKDADVPGHVADNAAIALSPDGPVLRRVTQRTQSGDTLASFARRHGTTAAQVAQWNKLSPQASLKSGQTLVVMVPARPRGTVEARKPATRAQATRSAARPATASGQRKAVIQAHRPKARVAQR
jgi:membrane-bound lytic murein transglycosylase D